MNTMTNVVFLLQANNVDHVGVRNTAMLVPELRQRQSFVPMRAQSLRVEIALEPWRTIATLPLGVARNPAKTRPYSEVEVRS